MSVGPFNRIKTFFSAKRKLNLQTLEQFEELLFESDLGPQMAQLIMKQLREKLVGKKELAFKDIQEEFRSILLPRLSQNEGKIQFREFPYVIFMVGANGVGKTTTIAKLAYQLKNEGKRVLLVAGDTFRAAATEQIAQWAKRLEVELFEGKSGGDPSALSFDAVMKAKRENFDVVIVDTAGRLHTKAPLMEELKKMKRVVQKCSSQAPHEIIMTLDANLGLSILNQCEQFHAAVGLTGLILTKVDGTARGGIIFKCAESLSLPILYLGTGEKVSDLVEFKAKAFLENFFSMPESD